MLVARHARHAGYAIAAALLVAAGWVAGTAAQPVRRYINPADPADPTRLPFSGAVLVGDTLYLSGQIGLLPGNKVPETPEAEAEQVLASVEKLLAEAGMTMDDLVSVQVFCADVAYYDAFNKVYRTKFRKAFPARAFIGSGKLLFGARFEVQGIAVRR
jgi:2-iminobutanoate/2-iminopropanoate deaminase